MRGPVILHLLGHRVPRVLMILSAALIVLLAAGPVPSGPWRIVEVARDIRLVVGGLVVFVLPVVLGMMLGAPLSRLELGSRRDHHAADLGLLALAWLPPLALALLTPLGVMMARDAALLLAGSTLLAPWFGAAGTIILLFAWRFLAAPLRDYGDGPLLAALTWMAKEPSPAAAVITVGAGIIISVLGLGRLKRGLAGG